MVFVDIDGSFSFVSGDWQVPTATAGPVSHNPFLPARQTWSAAWVGIDGHLLPLMQAGTDQMNETVILGPGFFSASGYFGWQEAFPEDPVRFPPDIPVSPGGQMSCGGSANLNWPCHKPEVPHKRSLFVVPAAVAKTAGGSSHL